MALIKKQSMYSCREERRGEEREEPRDPGGGTARERERIELGE